MTNPESHIKAAAKFNNFWSNVSKLSVGIDVPVETQLAIIKGTEKAYGPEAQGREHDTRLDG